MREFIGFLFVLGIIYGWIYLIRDASSAKEKERFNYGCVILIIILMIIGTIIGITDFINFLF